MAPGVRRTRRARLLLPTMERFDGCPLDRLEDAGVDIRLELANETNEVGAPAHPADSPAGHVESLGQRVELEPDFAGPWDLEQAERPVAVERDLRIGRVVAE